MAAADAVDRRLSAMAQLCTYVVFPSSSLVFAICNYLLVIFAGDRRLEMKDDKMEIER